MKTKDCAYFVWVYCQKCTSVYLDNLHDVVEDECSVCPVCGHLMKAYHGRENK